MSPSSAQRTLRTPGEIVPETGAASRSGALPGRARQVVRPAEWPVPVTAATPCSPLARPAPEVLRVTCSREGFARARRFTRETLHRWSLDHHGDDAALVVTELAANAEAHVSATPTDGEPEIRLGLALEPGRLMLSVSDPGDGAPVPTPSDDRDLLEHGRGLRIVDALAEDWGWTPRTPTGKTVWATLSTRPLT
ncbi:ATP-binding protein [Streptomyces sp. NPDC018947]|uniref:ATP-binding protein n=1 Tax=Streptomyces sp. NPDC018947 TaxID=3365054 RepID=UPI0037B12357